MGNVLGRRLAVLFAASFAWLFAAPEARAAGDETVERLVEYGHVPAAEARDLVRTISKVLSVNAHRGGEDYDWLRRTINKLEYGAAAGPGRTRVEFEDRMRRVLSMLERGLDERLLSALFPASKGSALRCTEVFDVTMAACDALIAAATRTPSPIPYARPDDGGQLRRELRDEGLSRREADRVVDRISTMMLGVPGNLDDDTRGQRLAELLSICPGGLLGKESQVRAWHVGPAEGMVRCIVSNVASRSGASAARVLADQLRVPVSSARGLLSWAKPSAPEVAAAPAASAAQDPAKIAHDWRTVARRHYRTRDYRKAVAAYQTAASLEPDNAGSYAGLGASRLAMGDSPGAVSAYQQAIELDPDNPGFYTAVARAQARIGDRDGAIASLRRALELDPTSRSAQQGLAHFGVRPEPPGRPVAPAGVAASPTAPAYVAERSRPAAPVASAPAARSTSPMTAPPAAVRPAAVRPAAVRPAAVRPAAAPTASAAPNTRGRAPAPGMRPMAPSRQNILSVMRPLQARIASCKPDFHGVVTFRISVTGATGLVDEVSVETPGLSDTVAGECMAGIVRGASFPAFQKPELEISYPYRL